MPLPSAAATTSNCYRCAGRPSPKPASASTTVPTTRTSSPPTAASHVPVTARGGKWEIHTNPHDARQVWIRLPDGHLSEIPWIHRDHIHEPFNSATWQHIKTITTRHGDRDTHEADLADALDQLMRRAHTGTATAGEQRLITRTAPLKTPPPTAGTRTAHAPEPQADGWDDDSLDDLDDLPDDPEQADGEEETVDDGDAPVPYTGLGLYDPAQEALNW
ncbi:hypothetical protein [Streptomyces antibioticus]|uniref:hypothetical protein n=1 Tax=Streptomyces antibioticus TaxID=1890 RepID=UPI001FD7FA0B|nr:hypothetical protein [Streptomyces antibioticus]